MKCLSFTLVLVAVLLTVDIPAAALTLRLQTSPATQAGNSLNQQLADQQLADRQPADQQPAQDQKPKPLTKSLPLQIKGTAVRYPEGWKVAPARFTNAHELLYVPAEQPNTANAAERAARAALVTTPARIMITSERRLDHADAVQRLKEIEAEEPASVTYLEIGGWPALQRRQLAPKPKRGNPSAQAGKDTEQILRITTAVAAGDMLIRLEGSLPPEAALTTADEIEAIGRGLNFEVRGAPDKSLEEIKRLRSSPSLRTAPTSATPIRNGPGSSGAAKSLTNLLGASPISTPGKNFTPFSGPDDFSDLEPGLGVAQRVVTSGSELEVAVTPNGQNIVVATNGGYSFSNDGGVTFTFGGTPTFPGTYFRRNGDPSLAVGRSGAIYYGLIGFPTSTTNSTAISVSTDNGQTFNYRSDAVVCPNASTPPAPPVPGACFADQEHIAADLFNAGPGGGDQVYSTWRNFDATDQDPALVCSSDSATTWSAPLNVGAGFVPRIGIGSDGFVYVIYRTGGNIMLHRFSSCATGLTPQAGFPRMVAAVSDVTCPVSGLDRCNDGNILSSHTIAVDDTNANHVYVTYATNTAAGNENVLVRDSVDGGTTWPAARVVQLNAAATGRRFMPWVCTVGGTAHVSWYDRRAASATNNDLTDFYRGSASISGGNLVAGPEVRLTDNSDAQCAPGFPCGSRAPGDSDACPVQPQLAGRCEIPGSNPVAGSFNACDFDMGPACPMGEVCTVFGGGCPKYGDYNGNACAAGRIYTAWASATAPTTVTPATPANRIDTFFDKTLVCCVPEIQAPASLTLPATCAGETSTASLNVCNTGQTNLSISGIASSNTQFSVSGPFPVNIAPGACNAFQVNFSPTSRGLKSATLSISSNDPVTPVAAVAASGLGKGLQSIVCPANKIVGNDPGLCSAVVNPGTPVVNADGCPVTVTGTRSDGLLLTAPYPVGVTTIVWKATDGGSNSLSCIQTITVNDIEAPVITGVSANPNVLWPPNHKMVNVAINYNVTDNCDPLAAITCTLSVTANEPINGPGDGNTEPDWVVVDAHHLQLRAERAGNGNGRSYTIKITCTDSKGNSSSQNVVVSVPKSQAN